MSAEKQHAMARSALEVIESARTNQESLSYKSIATKLGLDPVRYARAVAHACDLLDAAAVEAGVPLPALGVVLNASEEVNPAAWSRGPFAVHKDRIVRTSERHQFSKEDYEGIRRGLDALSGLGHQAAWRHIDDEKKAKWIASLPAVAPEHEGDDAPRRGEDSLDVRSEWSDEELRASVEAYRQMQGMERAGRTAFKRPIYRALSERFGRTEKAFEFRMQNISAVLAMMGREWTPGLKPASHVGTSVAVRLERIIGEVDGVACAPRVEFEVVARERRRSGLLRAPVGTKVPTRTTSSTTSFLRDPNVKAWVLDVAADQAARQRCGSNSSMRLDQVQDPRPNTLRRRRRPRPWWVRLTSATWPQGGSDLLRR